MKKAIALLLACMMLVLCACGGTPAEQAEPTPAPTPTPTPAPTYVNPLNGEIMDTPYTGRIFASTISNVPKAIPHVNLNKADIVFEMFVNGSIIRDLALFTNIEEVESFGAVRSTRPMFHDIVQHFDAVLLHSGGHPNVLSQLANLPVDAYNIDQWALRQAGVSFRDKEHNRIYENSLMGIGPKVVEYVQNDGVSVTQPEDKDYGLIFTDNGTPADGQAATELSVVFKFNGSSKETIMKYDVALGKYVYWQYTQEMRDQNTNEQEAFTNVIVMNTVVTSPSGYHKADFNQGGDGYFACGGKIIPIKWTCAGQNQPFKYTLEDGTPLELQRGNTYIAIAPNGSTVTYS